MRLVLDKKRLNEMVILDQEYVGRGNKKARVDLLGLLAKYF